MSEKPETDSGSTGEWRSRTGTHHQIDTMKLRVLDGLPPAEETLAEAAPGTDPYNRATPDQSISEKSRRRLLDDMRQLSETIKKSRNQREQ